MKKLHKFGSCTDIHWGAKANSELHNQDCLRYIDWFCDQVKKDPDIDAINFLGDWFENRSALNISTLKYADEGMRRLRALNLPIFFVVGNHDLYHRHTREVCSPVIYKDYDNVNIIDKPTVYDNIGTGALYSPYLFHEEYPQLAQYLNLETWWGHFEFKGFVITGYNIVMESGPSCTDFKGPQHIVSGHYHKRQTQHNVVYMGNTFPTSYSDAGDIARGMMTYDHTHDEMLFYNWGACPKYVKTSLSNILDDTIDVETGSRVKCEVDIPLTFEESTSIRQTLIEKYQLREFVMEESQELKTMLSETEVSLDWDKDKLASVDDLVMQMLQNIDSDHIDSDVLKGIYAELK